MHATPNNLTDAISALLDKIEARTLSSGFGVAPLPLYVGFGMGVHFHCQKRLTGDLDAWFDPVLPVPAHGMVAEYRGPGGARRLLYWDHINTPPIEHLLHPTYRDRAVEWPGVGNERRSVCLCVLAPLDLAVLKIGRLSPQDSADIIALSEVGAFGPDELRKHAEEAVRSFTGNGTEFAENIDRACSTLAGLQKPEAAPAAQEQVKSRELPEQRLCEIAGEHLRAQGWKVVSEVPYWERNIDLAAMKDGKVMLIEAKTSFTKRLKSQVFGVSLSAHLAIALVGTTPRPDAIEWARRTNVGIWRVTPDGKLEVVLEPRPQERTCGMHIQRMIEKITRMPESLSGGAPCLKGQGPAHAAEDATAAYRAAHPKATWAEIYANVPNHYSSASSMRSAAYSNRQRRAFMQRRRDARTKAKLASAGGRTGAAKTKPQ